MAKIFITGIAGFLGSHLADALIAQGHDVAGNDNAICGDWANVPDKAHAEHAHCDSFYAMSELLNEFKPEVVVHCAATAHEGLSSFSPSFITRNIYEASVATFSAAIASGVKRIVYMSSMSRYGDGRSLKLATDSNIGKNGPPFQENKHIPYPVDPYAVAKVAAEDTLRILAKTHNINYSILVPHNIIGTRQRVEPFRNVATIMINRCLQGKPPIVYGDGMQTRCFSPVKDCIPSIIKAIHGAADGEVVNIGPDKGEISIGKLATIICRLTGFDGYPEFMPDRPNEVKHAFCSSDKARRLLGYEEKQSVEDCLKEMIEHHKVKDFDYSFPIEITQGCPRVWLEQLL